MLPAKAGLGRVLAVAAALTLALPMPRAQTVFCTNCSTELTQLANNIQLVDQLARQVELVREAIAQTTNLTLNTQALDGQEWSGAVAEIRKLNDILAQAKSLSFTATDLDAQFARKYSDYNAYVSQQPDAETLGARLQQWSEDTNDSVLTTLKAAGLSARQIEGEEDSYLRGLERLAETAEGRMQAIQVGNQIAMAGGPADAEAAPYHAHADAIACRLRPASERPRGDGSGGLAQFQQAARPAGRQWPALLRV